MTTPTNPLSVTSGAIAFGTFVPARFTSSPTAWRLGRRNGELVLQAGSVWHEGPEFGIEWVDLPTVDLDNEAQP
jgi:hypothetical protein